MFPKGTKCDLLPQIKALVCNILAIVWLSIRNAYRMLSCIISIRFIPWICLSLNGPLQKAAGDPYFYETSFNCFLPFPFPCMHAGNTYLGCYVNAKSGETLLESGVGQESRCYSLATARGFKYFAWTPMYTNSGCSGGNCGGKCRWVYVWLHSWGVGCEDSMFGEVYICDSF